MKQIRVVIRREKIDDATLVSDDQNIDTEIEENTNEE